MNDYGNARQLGLEDGLAYANQSITKANTAGAAWTNRIFRLTVAAP
jgi:hypothetical protein